MQTAAVHFSAVYKPIISIRRHRHETDIPTQRDQAQAQSRFSCPDGDSEWSQGHCAPPRQGTCPADTLTLTEAAAHDREFPRTARLTQSRDFRAVFADARRHGDRHFTILVGHGNGVSARLGLAVAKRAAPRAVDRNRLKRLIRDRFRHHRAYLPAVDVVVMVRPVARQCENPVLIRSLDKLWQRISGSCESS